MIGAVLGTALSVVPLVVVQQVADGMIGGIVDRFVTTGTYHLQAVPYHAADALRVRAMTETVRGVRGVRSAAAERQGYGLLYSDYGRSGVTIRAVQEAFWRDDPRVQEYLEVVDGAFDLSAPEAIVLGIETAAALDARVGQSVRLLTVRPLGEGRLLPRVSTFTVAGIVSSGYRDLDRLWVFVDYERGVRIIPDDSAHDLIGIKIDDPYLLPNPLIGRGLRGVSRATERQAAWDTAVRISAALPREWLLSDWYSAERARYVGFLTSRNLLVLIMALVVLVASVNTASSLVLLVVEHEDEIAMLKATGASSRTVAGAFVAAATTVGSLGAAIGGTVGIIITLHINGILTVVEWVIARFGGTVTILSNEYYLSRIPVDLSWLPIAGAVALTVAVATVAGFLPARRAAGVAPERVLRRR